MEISRQEVIDCYRCILGREPENENVILENIRKNNNLYSLRMSLLNTKEFADVYEKSRGIDEGEIDKKLRKYIQFYIYQASGLS